MDAIRSYRDLDVWRVSMELTIEVYRVTDAFPATERFGLTAQIRRAASSIPANLAEGHGRAPQAYRNHVSIAIGSQAELETLLDLACRLNFIASNGIGELVPSLARTGQMLKGLARGLRRCDEQPGAATSHRR